MNQDRIELTTFNQPYEPYKSRKYMGTGNGLGMFFNIQELYQLDVRTEAKLNQDYKPIEDVMIW